MLGKGDVDFFGSEILYRIGCNLPCNAHTAVLRDHVARRAAGYATSMYRHQEG